MDDHLAPARLSSALRARLEPSLRRGLHLYWRVSRGMTLGVRGAAIDRRGRVCLVRHTYVPGWHLPGGGVEPGETALEALRREMAEEAEIVIGPGQPRLHGVFYNAGVSRRDHVLVFVLDDFSVRGPKHGDREIVAAEFFPLETLPDGTTPATRARLAEVTSGELPSLTW